MATTCTPANLISLGAQVATFSDKRMNALALYGLANLLAAAGGADYTSDFAALISAAQSWSGMNPAQNGAGIVELIFALATDKGASIPSDIDDLVAASIILENTPNQKVLFEFLACAVRNQL